MKLFKKSAMVIMGLLISFGCMADNPPCWKLESEGAAPGDVCWFSDKMPSGTKYYMSTTVLKDGKAYCFHEGEKEDRFIKQFGWLNGTWTSLREHFSSQQSVKSFIGSYKWCSDNKETRKNPVPSVSASDISEETVSLDTVIEDGVEYLSLGILSSVDGETRRLGKFYKDQLIASGNMLDIWVFYGCGWAVIGDGGSSHRNMKSYWTNECFGLEATSCSTDSEGHYQVGNRINKKDCDNGKNAAYVKIPVPASVLREDVRAFYKERQPQ